MHDYSISAKIRIQQQIKDALTEEIAILIDEMNLPNAWANWSAVIIDMTVMSEQRQRLVDGVILRFKEVLTYMEEVLVRVLLLVPK